MLNHLRPLQVIDQISMVGYKYQKEADSQLLANMKYCLLLSKLQLGENN